MHRLPSPMTETEFAQSLLAAAGAEAVPPGARERVAQRLGVRLQAKVPDDAAPSPGGLSAPATAKASAWSKVALLGVVGGLWVGGSALLPAHRAAAPKSVPSVLPAGPANVAPPPAVPPGDGSTAPSVAPSITDAPGQTGLEVPAKQPAPHARRNGATPAAAYATPAPGLLAEVRAIDRVRRALQGGRAARALSDLDDYAREFPHGELALEAAVLRVQALFGSARGDEARALARHTLAASGSERYRPELERMLGAER
jgi:hypothetical protein